MADQTPQLSGDYAPVDDHPFYSTGEHPQGPIADSQSSNSEDNDHDSAIGSFRSSQSTSLTPSVYEYRHDFGRRYHAARNDADYSLPNDEREMDRLDLQHHLCKMTFGGVLHRAPLRPGIDNHVLDLGTGTGIWAIDFAEQFKSAQVVGVDLSPIQPGVVPPNCQFYVDNFEKDWTFDSGSFDYIHGRMLMAAVKSWPRIIEQTYKTLRPGGWVEFQVRFGALSPDELRLS